MRQVGMTPHEIRRDRERREILAMKRNAQTGASIDIAYGADLCDTPITLKKKKRKQKRLFRP